MVALNENEVVVGYPPFASDNGVASGEICAISNEQRDRACRGGLAAAIAKKALHDGRGCTLVVFAQDFYCQLLDCKLFAALVEAVLEEHRLTFDSVSVMDSHDGFFVEKRLVT